ncbi:MAG: alpha-2-macroglobulin [Alphaproteobacteria bacterium]
MRYGLALAAVVMVMMANPAAADPVPATANQVSGPVTGTLPDKISLSLDPYQSVTPGLSHRGPMSISFCVQTTSHETIVVNGKSVRQSRVNCTRPDRKLHLAGKRQLAGVTLTPDMAGTWRWQDDYTLTFRPQKPWPAGQEFQAQFGAELFPGHVQLLSNTYNFTTDALTPQIPSMTFFQDPNDVTKRGVATTLRFNTPVAAEALRQHVTFTLEELTEGAAPNQRKIIAAAENLPFEFKLDAERLEAQVTTPMHVLPDRDRFVRVRILPGLEAVAGGKKLEKSKGVQMEESVRIPSRSSFAKISTVEMKIVKNDRYEPEQVIVITTNVPVTRDALAKSLQIRALPKDKPMASEAYSPKKDYAWSSAIEVTDAVLAAAPDVKFALNPTADDYATLHSVKLTAEPGRWLHVRVGKGMEAQGGYIMGSDQDNTVLVPDFAKEVRLLSDGALLALGGEKKVSVYALGAGKLRFKLHRVLTRDIGHLVSQTEGAFSDPNFSYGNFSQDNLSEVFTQEVTLPNDNPRQPQFTAFDFAPFLTAVTDGKSGFFKGKPNGKGLFFITIEAVGKDKKGQEVVVATDRRFVLLSDLGLVVKTNRDRSHTAFVQSVLTGLPVSGAVLEVIGANGLSILKVKTDSQGHADIPSLDGYANEKRPVAYVIQDDGDLAFMPYERGDRTLDYSRFETDGVHASEDGLKAYLFSDRGIYRPGETAHIGIIVKQGDWAPDLSGLPLRLEVTNPRGRVIDRNVVKLNAAGLVEYQMATKDTSPTGVYNIRLFIAAGDTLGTQLGSTALRVEEFLPDTMKIASAFSKPLPRGWVSPEGLKAMVTLEHLYGAPAVDHRVVARVGMAPGSFTFKDFSDYNFFDARRSDTTFEQPVGTAQTDAEGKVSFDLNLGQYGASTYRLTFYGEGFAQDSGRSVHTAKSVLVSPLPYVIGTKADSSLGYINKDTKRQVQMLALDPELRGIEVKGLTAQIFRIDYVSTLIKDERGAYVYRAIPKETPVAKSGLDIPVGGMAYPLDSAVPGSYALVISDSSGLVLNRVPYSIIGEGNMLGHARKDAVIGLKLSKPEYAPGEKIEMNITAPYIGAGLITLETDKVLAFKWFKTTTLSSVQSIAIPKEFSGKGFVNVTFVRALASKEVYTKPLAFAIAPFFVGTAQVDSQVLLSVPEKAKPGDDLEITYQTKNQSKIIIYVVDEGILQYGKYLTPDPLGYFVRQRALQVGTAQILDLLMPEYSIMQQRAASGGDGALADGKNLNPFKRKTLPPVAFWSGVIDADATPRTVRYRVPEHFNGSLRVMAMAVGDYHMGSAEEKTFVKGDVIISPNVPVFAAPGDRFTVGVAIANNIPGSGKDAKLKLTATASEHLEITSGKEIMLTIPEGGEAKAQIGVTIKSVLGGASLNLAAGTGDKIVRYEATLSVRPPLPSMTTLVSGYAEKDPHTVKQSRGLYKEFAAAEGSVSSLPISLIPGLAAYLNHYPYGCTEQILSKAMPAVALAGHKDLGGDAKAVEQGVLHTMSRLRELQNAEGGFGYWWSHGGQPSEFVSVYALHYMTLAKEKHFPVPDDTFRNTQDYVKRLVNRTPVSLNQARVQAYGIYLLTRNGEVTANDLPNLLRYLDREEKTVWHDDLTAVYIAASYRLMQLLPEANALLDQFALGDPAYWSAHARYWHDDTAFYNSLNRYAQYVSVLAKHFPERLEKLDRAILFRLANFIGEGSYNTLSSAYAVMAFSDYGAAATHQVQAQMTISQRNGQGTFSPLPLTGDMIRRAQLNPTPGEVQFSGSDKIGLFYQIVTGGYDTELPAQPVEDGLEISRRYQNVDRAPLKDVKVGATVEVVVTMRAHDQKSLNNLALVDLLPGGFEIVPDSINRPVAASTYDADNAEEGGDAASEMDRDEAAPDLWRPEMVDAREDRLIAFGAIPSTPVTYSYKIKAVNAGTFVVPPPYVESMYDRSIKARGVAGTLTVQ